MKTVITLGIVALMGTVTSAFAGSEIKIDTKKEMERTTASEEKTEAKAEVKQEPVVEAKVESYGKKPFHFEGNLANRH